MEFRKIVSVPHSLQIYDLYGQNDPQELNVIGANDYQAYEFSVKQFERVKHMKLGGDLYFAIKDQ